MPDQHSYRLQTLLNIRSDHKDTCEKAFVLAQNNVLSAQKTLDACISDLNEMIHFREQKLFEYSNQTVAGILNIRQMQIQKHHIESLKSREKLVQVEIERKKIDVDKLKTFAELKLKDMLKAVQDFKSLEKLKENWIQDRKTQMARKNEEFADEISQAQYLVQKAS